MSDNYSQPSPDLSGYMTTATANDAIATMNGRIDSDQSRLTALEAKKGLVQVGTATLGETALVALSLGVRRYSVTITGLAATDKMMVALNGIPQNGSLQDAYVSAANTVNVGVLVPTLGIGAVISVPIVIYKVA